MNTRLDSSRLPVMGSNSSTPSCRLRDDRRYLPGYLLGNLPGARFTKYLTTILRLSYDNMKVTIDLRRTSNLRNIFNTVSIVISNSIGVLNFI